MYFPPVFDRVRDHSAPKVNEKIDLMTEGRLTRLARADVDREMIIKRMTELDREWDIDRSLMAFFSVAGGATLIGGIRGRKKLLYLLSAQLGFLFLHATVGWCPPITLFRRLGTRTQREIESERYALERMLELDHEAAA